jgi:hypothetical protein
MQAVVQVLLAIATIPVILWFFTSISANVSKYPAEDRPNKFLTLLLLRGLIVFIAFGVSFGISETSLFLLAPFIAGGLIYYSSTLK